MQANTTRTDSQEENLFFVIIHIVDIIKKCLISEKYSKNKISPENRFTGKVVTGVYFKTVRVVDFAYKATGAQQAMCLKCSCPFKILTKYFT